MTAISRNIIILISFIWFCCPAVIAQGSPLETSNESDNKEQVIEEITVIGIQDVYSLKLQVTKAEDRVIELFNELNDDDLYDIHCRMIARTGTRIKSRNCTPVYIEKATADQAMQLLGWGMAAKPINLVVAIHEPVLFEKMNALIRENQEFASVIMKHQELKEKLEEKRKAYLHNAYFWWKDD